jgi:DNA-binding HxlR family transcriptional regulator
VSPCCEGALECPCPPIGLIDIVGKKWAVCVVSLLGKYGTVRFGPIQACLSGVSPATLTSTLRSLERARLIRREGVEGPRGPIKAYALTAAGTELYRSLMPLAVWLRTTGTVTIAGAPPPDVPRLARAR